MTCLKRNMLFYQLYWIILENQNKIIYFCLMIKIRCYLKDKIFSKDSSEIKLRNYLVHVTG